MDNKDQAHWHMEKKFNLAHIITTVALIVSAIFYFMDLDKRIDHNAQEIKHVKQLREEDQQRLEKRLDSINSKLDRLLER